LSLRAAIYSFFTRIVINSPSFPADPFRAFPVFFSLRIASPAEVTFLTFLAAHLRLLSTMNPIREAPSMALPMMFPFVFPFVAVFSISPRRTSFRGILFSILPVGFFPSRHAPGFSTFPPSPRPRSAGYKFLTSAFPCCAHASSLETGRRFVLSDRTIFLANLSCRLGRQFPSPPHNRWA